MSLPIIRSLADIGKKYSLPRDMTREDSGRHLSTVQTLPNMELLQKSASSARCNDMEQGSDLTRNSSFATDLKAEASPAKPNLHLKKIPPGAEAANVLVGGVDFLNHQIVSIIRLKSAVGFGTLTEVPVPSKFIFILISPLEGHSKYHEIGRSMATLLTDEVFRDVAYHALNRDDRLAGIDEFLDQVTVLPPGEWEPSIRIEPPKSVPSQSGRKTGESKLPMPNGKVVHPVEEESHNDPGLQRTGRLKMPRKKGWSRNVQKKCE